MKRLLLSLICCSPLLFFPSVSFSIDLLGPNDEKVLSYEQYGPITSVETLWSIATKLRSDSSVSIQQTLVAIYKLNPYAFDKGNINKLIPESIISVPTFDFISLQTDKEATALLNKYSTKKQNKKLEVEASVVKPVEVIEKTATEEVVDSIAASLFASEVKTTNPVVEISKPAIVESLIDKEELIALQSNIDVLQEELNISSEELIVATEMNQNLKQKLQPVEDELQLLNKQLKKELLIQKKLQQIIDDYKTQIDTTPLPPFSGEGLLNKVLQKITSSLTNLLITILSPLLLLLSIFVLLMRIRSKRELAEQEQELAESTATLMEESGQFDALLTEDFSEEPEEELDFAKVASTEQELTEKIESISLDDEEELTQPQQNDAIELMETQENSSDVVNLTVEDELETVEHSEDDPFGIGALTEEEELIETVDLDESEIVAEKEDDPFSIEALAKAEELVETVDLDETEQEDLIENVNLDESKAISAEEQADLDLATEWESQLSEQIGDEEVKPDDVAEQNESEVDLIATSKDVIEEEVKTEVSGLDTIAELELELSDNEDVAEFEIVDDEFDATALDDLQVNVQPDNNNRDQQDLLAKQLSDVAFNEDAPLPKVNKEKSNDFIDIETLLESSDEVVKDELYSELELDLGLDEFPDVVNSEQAIDIDIDENGIGAQLDLARAYLEIDDKAGAKEILLAVKEKSNASQLVEIEKLLNRL